MNHELADGFLYVLANDRLIVIEERSREHWTYNVQGNFRMTVADESAYLGVDLSSTDANGQSEPYGVAYALDRRAGEERWSTHVGGEGVQGPPCVGNDALYVTQHDGTVHSLMRDDRSEQWVEELDSKLTARRPIVTDDVVLLTTE